MSIWGSIRKKSLGQEQRLENKTPILIIHTKEYLSKKYWQIKYKGRVAAYETNDFYPKGLVEYYEVEVPLTINGIELRKGDAIVECEDKHYEYDYYLYRRKVRYYENQD